MSEPRSEDEPRCTHNTVKAAGSPYRCPACGIGFVCAPCLGEHRAAHIGREAQP